jgi:hypothetical protein
MSRTNKDSKHRTNVLELIKRDDGTFDLFLNQRLHRSELPETSLPDELCVRFGFCGQEYVSIVSEINQKGRATLLFP